MKHSMSAVALGLLLVLVAGCSTPQSRSKERASAFSKMSAEEQRMVLEGRIKEGMNNDAVYVALGTPARIVGGHENGQDYTRWVYTRAVTRSVPAFRTYVGRGHCGRYTYDTVYEPYWETYYVDSFEVRFVNGRVTGWRGI